MNDRTYNVLFLCTGNSARSVMAEALLATLGKGRFRTYSAGSNPIGKINRFAIEQVRKTGYDLANLRSKSWDEFAISEPSAPNMDFVITVCDQAAGEVCPLWPGHPASAHWSFSDPAAVEGPDESKRAAFKQVFQQIRCRVEALVEVPLDELDAAAIRAAVRRISDIDVTAIGTSGMPTRG
ncbi:arsenate reductase ArsC [Paraburkholderia hospita]|jgi:arsenate reductase|uniref:arsenate reductase ArsC n=1 Tax=Paraburkholderia hospita TaxID=169430 RepID=UPI000271AE2B|nr:arsenate reductase ArsC [Paraburkholderia hospita]EUC12480.1 protein tyrosine phosphatase [Burkholderia sp. BT03]SKC50299.1 Protein-tyrosine-phosphatase [Paraburkholderia hospita]SKD05320.1 Protein-tyrosine-phosphatase [Burkholderia sp. CF099]